MSSELKVNSIRDTSNNEALTISSGNVSFNNTISAGTIGSGVTLNASTRTLTSEVSLSGSATPVLTNDVPSNAKEIKILVNGASTSSGSPDMTIQLGTGSSSTPSFKTTGYACVGGYLGAASALEISSNGFILKNGITYTDESYNSICLTYYGGNKWFFTEQGHYNDTNAYMSFGQGYVSLSAQLTQIRMANDDGVNFDAGNAVLMFCV